MYGDDLAFRVLEVLEAEPGQGLSTEQWRALDRAADRCRTTLSPEWVYRSLCEARAAKTALDRRVCLADAWVMQPDVLLELLVRARASEVFEPDILRALAERFSDRPLMADQLLAQELLVLAAQRSSDAEAEARARGELEVRRRWASQEGRLCLDWPIEALELEVLDALAHDEVALVIRCLFASD